MTESYAIVRITWPRPPWRKPPLGKNPWGLWKSIPPHGKTLEWGWRKIPLPGEPTFLSDYGDGCETPEEIAMFLESIGVRKYRILDGEPDWDALSLTGRFVKNRT